MRILIRKCTLLCLWLIGITIILPVVIIEFALMQDTAYDSMTSMLKRAWDTND